MTDQLREGVRQAGDVMGKIVSGVQKLKDNKMGLDNSHYFEDNSKIDDIRGMLDSNSDKEKMEAMKRLIAMMARGKDQAANLFPHVAKNVVTKNVELKKLVYMYLMHYAEVQPDSALLAINSFQKDLAASNQYIRASALRVMSSIRVKLIVQLIVLAIQKCVKDSSPYVRKATAHAISKAYQLEKDLKSELIEIIKQLLADRSTIVIGSAIAAWQEVCSDRIDLLHPHFRKICRMLPDLEEWGQIAAINVLTRYARTQFADPNKEKAKPNADEAPKKKKKSPVKKQSNGWDSDEEAEVSDDDNGDSIEMDADLRLLLDKTVSMLKSRNSGVVMAVASLYYFCAPSNEIAKVGKALIRIALQSQKEIQYVVLANLTTIAATRPQMLEAALQDFFIKPSDATFCRNLKLEILTSLVTAENINRILKEFKTYVEYDDAKFVAATIQAIGRSASRVPEVTDRCLHGLMQFVSGTRSDVVTAESVVVIRKLLQMLNDSKAEEVEQTMTDVIIQLSRLVEKIEAPSARASITWVIGEYAHKVPKIAPDILRKLAKTFANEDDSVKLQILNLGSKLYLTNPQQTTQLFDYVLTLAKYDINYDVRDKARVMRSLLLGGTSASLKQQASRLFLTKKPLPSYTSPSEGRQRFAIGTLSHILDSTVAGYEALPDFPEVPPPKDVRDEIIEEPPKTVYESASSLKSSSTSNAGGAKKKDSFWSDEEDENESDKSGSESGSDDGSGSEQSEKSDKESNHKSDNEDDDAKSQSSYSTGEGSTSHSEDEMEKQFGSSNSTSNKKENMDDLFGSSSTPTASTSSNNNAKSQSIQDLLSGDFAPIPSPSMSSGRGSGLSNSFMSSLLVEMPKYTLLKSHMGAGLLVEYSYSRSPSMLGSTINTLLLKFTNRSQKVIEDISMPDTVEPDIHVWPFLPIEKIEAGESVDEQMSLQFDSSSAPIKFSINTSKGSYPVQLTPAIGELVRTSMLTQEEYQQAQKNLKGMNAAKDTFVLPEPLSDSFNSIPQLVQESANLSNFSVNYDTGVFTFSGRTMLQDCVLICVVESNKESGNTTITVGSDNTLFNPLLMKEIKSALMKTKRNE